MNKKYLTISLLLYLLICAFYYAVMAAMTDPGYPLDDSWIHQVFARNIASGHGFTFNPGVPVSGATAPLWPLLLAPFWAVFGPVASGILLGVILQGLALIAVYKLSLIILENNRLALFSTALSIFFWPVIWGAMSGMETGLFSALSLWGLYIFFKSGANGNKKSYAAYALFTLSFLSRPECALFLAALIIHDIVRDLKNKNLKSVPWVIKFAIIGAITAPYFIFNYIYAGSPFPNTFSAKVLGKGLISSLLNFDIKAIFHSLTVYPYFYFQHFYRKIFAINPFIVVALVPGFIKLAVVPGENRSKRIMLVLLFIIYAPAMGALSPVFSATWQNFRYITNLLPLLIIMGVAGIFQAGAPGKTAFRKPLMVTAIIFSTAGIFFAVLFGPVSRSIIPLLVPDASVFGEEQFTYLTEVISRVGIGTLLLALMMFSGYLYSKSRFEKFSLSAKAGKTAIVIMLVQAIALTSYKAGYYADNVRNINECDVAAGKMLGALAIKGDIAAVNDIGAIGYYSGMEIFDLWGLINKELSADMINNDSLAFEYMVENKRVDYMVIAPEWFDYLPRRTDIFIPIAELTTENNTILAQDKNIVYKAVWPDSITYNYREPR